MLTLRRRTTSAEAPTLELNPANVSLTWEGTSQTVNVTSNTNWDVVTT